MKASTAPRGVETEPRLVIRPDDAYEIALLLRLGARGASVDGWRPSPRAIDLIASVEWLDAQRRTPEPALDITEHQDDQRITTGDAAAILGITPRQVRNIAQRIPRSHRLNGCWSFSLNEVCAEARARKGGEACGNRRTAAASKLAS